MLSGTGLLFIGASERAAIKAALDRAREKPVPLGAVIAGKIEKEKIALTDRHPGMAELRPRSENVMLGTYRAAVSFEDQPSGLCCHLSISSAMPGKIPGPEVVTVIVREYGCPAEPGGKFDAKAWIEEFEPGHWAINFVWLDKRES